MNVVFDDEQMTKRRSPAQQKPSRLAMLMIQHSGGMITDEAAAHKIMLIGCGVLILVSILILTLRTGEVADINPNIDPATGEYLPGEI